MDKCKCLFFSFIFLLAVCCYLVLTQEQLDKIKAAKFDTYHTAEEVDEFVVNSNDNPFYTHYVVGGEKMSVYGPVDDAHMFSVRILMVCGQHGRELVPTELCLKVIQALQMEDSIFWNATKYHGIGVWIVPLVNAWSRVQAFERGDECQRHNANGVDLNRNFPLEYSSLESKAPGDEEYAGSMPFSEWESRAIDECLKWIEPQVLFNVHSGSQDILLPFDYTEERRPDDYNVMVRLANLARKGTSCKVGQGSLLLYPAYGTLGDHAVLHRHVQLAYTLEIYGRQVESCFAAFNPSPGIQLQLVLEEWVKFLANFIDILPSQLIKN